MDVDDYLANAPEPQRTTLLALRATLREIVPDATEEMSYGMPAFKVDGKPVAGYAYFKNHCSYFPHSGTVLARLGDDLAAYDTSKGTLKFDIDTPLPRGLVQRLVEAKFADLAERSNE